MKKAVKKYLFGFVLLIIFCSLSVKAEDEKTGLNTAYYTVLETYLEAASGGDSSINETFFRNSSDSSVFFALLDIDGNGIQELFLANGLGEVIDAFTYKDGCTIRLLTKDMGGRTLGYICEDGFLKTTGSSGAAYPWVKFYKIREDAKSCDMVELYKMDTDQGIMELVDGSIVPYGPDDFFAYNELHGRKTVNWILLSEENIQATFDSVDGVDENWSEREIIQAPIFRMGVCDNHWELLESYYLRQLREIAAEDIEFDYNNNYYYEQDYNTDIQFIGILSAYSKWPYYFITVNTKTGEVKEVEENKGVMSRLNLIDADIMPANETQWYQPCLLEKEELFQKYIDLIAYYEERYGETTISATDEFRVQINGIAYLELIDFDNDGKEELLIVYNKYDSTSVAEYRFEIWGASGNEIVMKDTGPLYMTDGGVQTLKICEINGLSCIQNGMGGDFSFEYYHGYDGDGISVISTMYMQEGENGYIYSIDGDGTDKEAWDAEWNNRNAECRNYTLNRTYSTDGITAKIIETKNVLNQTVCGDIQYHEQATRLTPEQAEQGLSNYLAANYPTGRHYPFGEQSLDKYSVWAIYPTSAEEKLTVDLATGDVYAEGPYFGGGQVNEDFPVEIRYLINVYDYISVEQTSEPLYETVELAWEIDSDSRLLYGNHQYLLLNINDYGTKSYSEMETICEEMGGYLAVIDSEEENQVLYQYVLEEGWTMAFFGYSDEGQEGNWLWSGNRGSTYTNWAEGQPNNGANNKNKAEENYAHFVKNGNGTWNDAPFGANTCWAICEWDYT